MPRKNKTPKTPKTPKSPSKKAKGKECKSCEHLTDNPLNCMMYSVDAKNDIARHGKCEYFKRKPKEPREEPKEEPVEDPIESDKIKENRNDSSI